MGAVYFILQMRKAESTSALDDIKKAEEQERQVTLEAGSKLVAI